MLSAQSHLEQMLARPVWIGVDWASGPDITGIAVTDGERLRVLPPACVETLLAVWRVRK